jgi:hypothetical protein
VGANSPPAAALFVCLVVSFGMVTVLRVIQRGRTEATVAVAVARTTSYRVDEAGKVDLGGCFIGNGGEQGVVGYLFACLALLSAVVFHHFTLFHRRKLYSDRSLSTGPFVCSCGHRLSHVQRSFNSLFFSRYLSKYGMRSSGSRIREETRYKCIDRRIKISSSVLTHFSVAATSLMLS